MANSKSWDKIFSDIGGYEHDFDRSPLRLSATQIKRSCQDFTETNEKEVRILCKQDTREARPDIFVKKGLFLLPEKNGHYLIVSGEGYVDIPEINSEITVYKSRLDFELETSKIGNSEMQHLDFAYASSLIRTFMDDPSLVLTIRGRKYTPAFKFRVGKHWVETESVQTEVDAGYEGRDKIVLIEAKNGDTKNTIIRQLYYPFKQWDAQTTKNVFTLFFEKSKKEKNVYSIWMYGFMDSDDYNSVRLLRAAKYRIENGFDGN